MALVARDRVVVMGGFIGSTSGGVTTTLERGGSDPRALAGGWRRREIGYAEAQEMARCGPNVLCPTSIEPALRQLIPIVIRNSRRPEVEGTRIVSKGRSEPGLVKCLTSKAGMSIVHLRVGHRGMLSSITDGLANLFAREQVSVDLIQTTEHGISFAVPNWPGLSTVLRKVDESVEIEV